MLAGCLGPLSASCGDDSSSAPPSGDDNAPGKDATAGDSSQPGHDASGDVTTADAGDGAATMDGADAADVGFDVQEGSFNCMVTYDGGSVACGTCVRNTCCGMLQNCESDPGCSAALQCFETCELGGGTYDACYGSCVGSGADSILFIEFAECAQAQCGASCGFGDGGSVTVPSDSGLGG